MINMADLYEQNDCLDRAGSCALLDLSFLLSEI